MDVEKYKNIKSYIEKLQEDFNVECYTENDSIIDEFEKEGISEKDIADELDDDFTIDVSFPDEMDYTAYSADKFCEYMNEIDSFTEVDKSTVRTTHIRQTIIDSEYRDWYLFEEKIQSYKFKGEGYVAQVITNPFLIGLYNSKEGNYDEDYGVYPCSRYLAIELKYEKAPVMTPKEEDLLMERICYFLTQKVGVSVYTSYVLDAYQVKEDLDEEKFEAKEETVDTSSLISFTQLTRMYLQAKSTMDDEIKFLYFYKIIEYISPVVARLTAYEKLNKRLDLLAQRDRDYKYLDSIFAISRKYDNDVKDDYLCASVIQTCVDAVPLWEYIPEHLQKSIKQNLKLNNNKFCDENLTEDQIASYNRQLASSLYATRNSIVHAKSNYKSTGIEFQAEEMENANRIMDVIATSIIQWNERQPDIYKLKED